MHHGVGRSRNRKPAAQHEARTEARRALTREGARGIGAFVDGPGANLCKGKARCAFNSTVD